jgi:hypothetical protein
LAIVEGAELQDGFTVSTGTRPWLRSNADARRLAGRWVRLTYISGLLDPLARPVLRCIVDRAGEDQILPGPCSTGRSGSAASPKAPPRSG